MSSRSVLFLLGSLLAVLVPVPRMHAQETNPALPAAPTPLPKGVEVLARGPIHEAFASLTAEPQPTKPVPRQPPKLIDEMPPAEKPEGDVHWISGYWAWDDERNDFLWVSGIWRTPPPGKQWIAGYWREQGEQWQWVPGFWTAATPPAANTADGPIQQMTYLPPPPPPPQVAPPTAPAAPAADAFFVPGSYVWRSTGYVWQAGYWARIQPGYVWVPSHYRWTPSGCVFIPGYWDLALSRRGVLYAPVVINPVVVTSYTPVYAVSDSVVVEALFVRPTCCHYYFGDYYAPAYRKLGFECGYVYGRGRYDSLVVYEGWAHRAQPNWITLQVNLFHDRAAGRAPCPPRTLVQQNIIIQQNIVNKTTIVNRTVLAPASQVVAARGIRVVTIDTVTRQQARQQAVVVQQVTIQRTRAEVAVAPNALRQPRVASLSVPQVQTVRVGMTAPRPAPVVRTAPARPVTTVPVPPRPGPHPAPPPVYHPGPIRPPVPPHGAPKPPPRNSRDHHDHKN